MRIELADFEFQVRERAGHDGIIARITDLTSKVVVDILIPSDQRDAVADAIRAPSIEVARSLDAILARNVRHAG